jgi:hypothetical protein
LQFALLYNHSVIAKFLEEENIPDLMVFMMQKRGSRQEYAKRREQGI